MIVQRKRPGNLFVDQKVESGQNESRDETHHNQIAHLGQQCRKVLELDLELEIGNWESIPLMGRLVCAIQSNWIKSKPTVLVMLSRYWVPQLSSSQTNDD